MALDVVVVGAGVIGLACAERLSRDRSVLILERNASYGRETSSRSSQVIHAGIHHPAGFLKSELCARGNRSLYAWCEAHRVPHARVGKWIVAAEEGEIPYLDALLERAKERGVPLERRACAEPNVRCVDALHSPSSGILDVHAFMSSLAAVSRATLATHHELVRVAPGWELHVRDARGEESVISAPRVVNAAGLFADRVAALAGTKAPAQRFVKGSYFRSRKRVVRSLVYPVPPSDLRGLGVHATVELDGAVRFGPDAEDVTDLDVRVDERKRSAFHAALSRYIRGLEQDDLVPDQAGIRPKLEGEQPRDFHIAEQGGWVDLVGIESPGLTCALEIAAHVARLLG